MASHDSLAKEESAGATVNVTSLLSLVLIALGLLIDNSSKVWRECFVVEDSWKYPNSKGPTNLL